MGRKKIRNFESAEYYKELINNYIDEHRAEIIAYLVKEARCSDIETLRDDEYKMKFGMCCGWYNLGPKNPEMQREWKLDDSSRWGKIICPVAYSTQLLVLQKPQVDYILDALDLTNVFEVEEHWD